ncbi:MULTISPECIES: ABC transporter substrate-binding protein [unclassified Oleiphilus]|nr:MULTISPECIES: transporter substrate-binding domain-containing protein [unclassified Oleiphilus]KZY32441.1 hypothetical protein A3729_07770 [Oleiphilus sp. HI0043]KZZ62982.1 hypothetical protein A3763_07225 [Oleiphilus sp. HI0128]
MKYQIIKNLAAKLLLFAIFSLGFTNAHPQSVIALTAPENAFVQDISVQVLKKAYNKIGYQVEIHRLPNVRSLLSANMGMFDGEVSRIGNLHSSYPNLNAVPTAINMINIIALGKHSSERVSKIKDLGHDVVCVKGVKLVEKLVEDNKIQCTFVVNTNQALSMVALGRVKYTLLPETNALKALLTEPFENVKIVSPVLYSEKLYHYLHKNNLNIVEPLDKVLRKMQKNGDIDQIRTRFLENIL